MPRVPTIETSLSLALSLVSLCRCCCCCYCFQEIVNGAAIQAKIPTALVRKQEGGKIGCTSGTMDCVVSVYGFSSGVAAAASGKDGAAGAPATVKGLASEVARVLKPGGTVLFVEKGEAKELVRDFFGVVCCLYFVVLLFLLLTLLLLLLLFSATRRCVAVCP